MLGNEENARFIRDWYLEQQERYYSGHRREETPKGWERLGGGCYRVAYLHIESGVVYKVEHSYGVGYTQSNKDEAEYLRSRRTTKLPEGCRFPRYRYFELDGRGVMAMERFTRLLRDTSKYGDDSKYWERLGRLQATLYDLYDMHGSNLAIDEESDELVPIDLGG